MRCHCGSRPRYRRGRAGGPSPGPGGWRIGPGASWSARQLRKGVGDRDVVPPGGGGPEQDAGLGLVEPPALRLFTSMVAAAQRRQVALTGTAALVVGGGVVQIAAGGGPLAAGGGAGGVAGPDQMLEPTAGLVAGLLVPVVAEALSQRGDRNGQGLGGVLGRQLGQGAGAGQAAMADGPAVLTGEGNAVPGPRISGGGAEQMPCQGRVDRSESGHNTRGIRCTERRAQRDSQVDRRPDPGRLAQTTSFPAADCSRRVAGPSGISGVFGVLSVFGTFGSSQ